MTINKKVAAVVSTIAIATTLGLAKMAKAEQWTNPNGFPAPNITKAKTYGTLKKDIISEIPGKETTVTGYTNPDGTFFNTLEYKGHLFGFYVDTNGKMPLEYTLLDLDGDGKFEYKSSKEGENPSPQYIMNMAQLGKY